MTDTEDIEVLRSYYQKCNDNLQELNKRSNWVSRLILIIAVLYLFPTSFTKMKLFDVEFDVNLVHLVTPTLLSYLIFEWLMIAKRRRDLIVAIQQLSYKLFAINPTEKERFFPAFNPNTLNIMPFSIMNEVSNIERERKFNLYLIRVAIACMLVFLLTIIIVSLIASIESYHLQPRIIWPGTLKDFVDTISLYISTIICTLFLVWIVYYYKTEFRNLRKLKALAEEGKKKAE